MKSIIKALAASAAFALSGCLAGSLTAPVNEEFTLRSGRDITIESSSVRIRFIGVITDSRCPTDVQCIWSGNAQVELEVRANNVTDTLTLNTDDGVKEGVVGHYRIVLVALAPVPVSTMPIDPASYRATLKVFEVGESCTLEARPALAVSLTDSLNPSVSTFTSVSVVAVDGTYRDSSFVETFSRNSGFAVSLAHERAGFYTVTVRADGYAPWTRSGIEVQKDPCHVVTVPVTARLQM